MKNDAEINDQEYWDRRFREDWETFAGPRQSRFFAQLALDHLPPWILELARREKLTLADWGCAQGDGTELVASCLAAGTVTGIDFAATAIEQAIARYPGVRFVAEDWLAEGATGESFDIVFSSNTLEHFHEPLPVLERIATHARKAVLLALPYRELDRHKEHFHSFLPQNIPAVLGNGFRLTWARVIDCKAIPDTCWLGEQVLLAYVDPAWADQRLALTMQDVGVGTEPALLLDPSDPRSQVTAESPAVQLELSTLRAELERQAEQMRRNAALVAQAGELQREVEDLRRQNTTLRLEAESRNQELQRVSTWATEISRNPARYAIKRHGYLLVREVYRRLPITAEGKQKLKNLARRVSGQAAAAVQAHGNELTRTLAARGITPQRGPRDVFVFAVIDWHFRIQRPQHLARGMAQSGRRVFFFSNVFIDAEAPGYQLERLDPELELFQVKLHVKGAPAIYFSCASDATLRMLQASLAIAIADFGALSSISMVQHAFWYPLVAGIPNSLRMYDCMDHHEGFGNVPAELVQAEHRMLRESDLVLVTSSWLQEFAAGYNPSLALVRNAVEYEFFATAPADVYRDDQGRRIIGYYGAIAEWFDIELVRRVAQAHPDCLVLLVGNDTVNAARQLSGLRNVQFTGEVPYRELPHYLYAFDVCLLPFQVTPLTLATNPVKVYEYLAAGKPVVCVDLPEVSQFTDLVSRAASADDFVRCVGEALHQPPGPVEVARRRAFAARQTWQHRAVEVQQAIEALRLPRVSVIVLTYNNLELTKNCLRSVIEESDYPNLELVIVDNASSDGSPDYLQAFAAEHPGTRLILNDSNLGFAAGNNVGLAAATGEYLVILNNDTVVTRGWVMTLLRHLQKDARVGMAGPVTNNIGNAARVPTAYARIEDMPAEAFALTLSHMGSEFPLRTAAFFCVMMHRAVYEACGPMCEDFGRGFFEDDDYCRRIEQEGLRVVCAEDVFVHHHLSASFNKVPSAERQALFDGNKARYEEKWGPWEPHSYERNYVPAVVDPPQRAAHDGARKFMVGHCAVCGQQTRFFYTDEALWRETLTCERCRCTSRYRALAHGILRAVRELADVEAQSLATLPRIAPARRLAVYDTQPPFYYAPCAYPLPDMLKRTGWIDVALSQYKPELAPGAAIGPGITNQNLEALTFASGSLDLLVTSDVMEHVRLDEQAHREIHRVLRTGGVYVFNVPHEMEREKTLVRVGITDPANPAADVMLMEPEYHGDTNGDGSGVLAYRYYGRDLVATLEAIGFEVHYTRADVPHEGVMNTELFYCRKVR